MLQFFRKDPKWEVDSDLPLKSQEYVAMDTELSGLDGKKDSIISVGAVKMRDGRIMAGETFYMMARPGSRMKKESVVIHGIIPSEAARQLDIDEVLSEFHPYCGRSVLVGHCISIDLQFMDREMKKITGKPVRNSAVDTCVLHSFLMRRVPAYAERFQDHKDATLFHLADRLGIPSKGAHNALMDAFMTARVFQMFLPLLEEAGIHSLGELLKAGDPYKGGEVFERPAEISNL